MKKIKVEILKKDEGMKEISLYKEGDRIKITSEVAVRVAYEAANRCRMYAKTKETEIKILDIITSSAHTEMTIRKVYRWDVAAHLPNELVTEILEGLTISNAHHPLRATAGAKFPSDLDMSMDFAVRQDYIILNDLVRLYKPPTEGTYRDVNLYQNVRSNGYTFTLVNMINDNMLNIDYYQVTKRPLSLVAIATFLKFFFKTFKEVKFDKVGEYVSFYKLKLSETLFLEHQEKSIAAFENSTLCDIGTTPTVKMINGGISVSYPVRFLDDRLGHFKEIANKIITKDPINRKTARGKSLNEINNDFMEKLKASASNGDES